MTVPTPSPLPSPPPPSQEILSRTRVIDTRTDRLMALLDLLEEREGPSPLEALRETLVEILLAQREAGNRLARIEGTLRLPAQPPRPAAGTGSAKPPPRTASPAA